MIDPSALDYLDGLQESRIRPGLERIEKALACLGSPHLGFPHIIVGGTNGKGSVVAFLGRVLGAAGFSVGCFTSPHLHRFEERIVVDHDPVDSGTLENLVEEVRGTGIELSYFEFATALALLHFNRKAVDIAVLEVGLGGRWDATNATDPIVSVITSVSLDHTEWLGADVSGIAVEKAMILRPGRPLIVNGVGAAALEAILSTARSFNAIPVLGGHDFSAGWEDPGRSMWFRGKRWSLSGLSPGLPGMFQMENAATALAALECLEERGFNLDPAAIAGGISEAVWPGRFQDLGGAPDILVDAAHNRAAMDALIRSLQGRKRIVWLFSALVDKDIEGMGAAMLEAGKDFVLVPLDNPRACPLGDLERRIPRGARAVAALTLAEGLKTARSLAGPDGTVVVAGSIYLAGEVLRIVGPREGTSGRGG